MHTARLVPISPSMHCAGCLPMVGEGSASGPGGGGVCSCVCVWGGGCLPLVRGVLQGDIPACIGADHLPPPPVNRILDMRF